MSRTIELHVDFAGVEAEQLFDTYLDPTKHAEALGAPVTVSAAPGARFAAFGEGMVRGRNLLIAPKRMIVQTWRAHIWNASDPDSVLVLSFEGTASGGRVELVQIGVPDSAYRTIRDGWKEMYWKPWKRYLRAGHAR